MWRRLTIVVLVAVLLAAPAGAAPYVSCPGGYIAQKLSDCPVIPTHPVGGPDVRGGGGQGGGVLGGLLRRLGLGGLF